MNLLGAMPDSAEKQVVRLLEDIVSSLPSGCARIEFKNLKKGFTEVALVPSNDHAAEFGAMFFDEELYAVFFRRGKCSTTYECPWEIKLTLSDSLEKHLAVLKRMCLAVIEGKCEHRLGHISLRGSVYVDESEVYRVIDLPKLPPRMQAQVIRYLPFCPGAEKYSPSLPIHSL